MFLYLSKLLPPFIYPVGLVTILILVALLTSRHPKWQRIILLLALGVLFIAGNSWVSASLLRSLEWRYIPQAEIPQGEVIILLGGGTMPAEYPRSMVEFNSAGDRVLYAAQLYHQGKADHILASGGTIEWLNANDTTAAQEMASLLELLQVPEEAIWLEADSRNTHENAVNTHAMLAPMGIKRIILVTSAVHMPRSVALFEMLGFDVIPAPTDYRITRSEWDRLRSPNPAVQLLNLIPSAENLSQTSGVLKEYFGLFIYRLRGWL